MCVVVWIDKSKNTMPNIRVSHFSLQEFEPFQKAWSIERAVAHGTAHKQENFEFPNAAQNEKKPIVKKCEPPTPHNSLVPYFHCGDDFHFFLKTITTTTHTHREAI
jgi:hypothetical protein